jgi:hypothetical protein
MDGREWEDRSPLLRPSRWPVLAGLIAIGVGIAMPWQTMIYPSGGPVVRTGLSGFGAPGLQILVFAIPAALAAGLRTVADSHTRTVQLLPALLAGCVLVLTIEAYRDVAPADVWDPSRGQIVIEGGMWTVLAGAVAMALGGVSTSLSIIRANPLWREPWEPPVDLSFVPWVVSAGLGFAISVVGAVVIGQLNPMLSPFVVIGGSIVATLVIERLWRAAAAAWRPGRAAPDRPEGGRQLSARRTLRRR